MTDLKVCMICTTVWLLALWGGAGFAVFILGQSGWWFALAILLSMTGCKRARSPEQLNAAARLKEAKAKLKLAKRGED